MVGEKAEDILSNRIIGAAIRVHSELGPGLLESVYESCLEWELLDAGMKVERQKQLPVGYRGRVIDSALRIDMLVEDLVVLELKCVEKVLPIHEAQALTYLKLSGRKLCLLLNFNVIRMKEGIHRIVLGL